jgi:hypothetical protein
LKTLEKNKWKREEWLKKVVGRKKRPKPRFL